MRGWGYHVEPDHHLQVSGECFVLKFYLQVSGSHWRTAEKGVMVGPTWPGNQARLFSSDIWWSHSHLYYILTNHEKFWINNNSKKRYLLANFKKGIISSSQLISSKNCSQLVSLNSHYSLFWKGYNWNKTSLA